MTIPDPTLFIAGVYRYEQLTRAQRQLLIHYVPVDYDDPVDYQLTTQYHNDRLTLRELAVQHRCSPQWVNVRIRRYERKCFHYLLTKGTLSHG